MKNFIFAIACLGFVNLGFKYPSNIIHSEKMKENIDDSLILWNSSKKLTWLDFQGKIKENSKYKALTYATVELKSIRFTNDTIIYEIPCWFEKKLSWSMNKESNELLKHEQLHFDIAELATRRMRKKLQNSNPVNTKIAKELILKCFDEEEAERASLNKEYDEQTEHGIIATKQKEWELKIAKELKSLDVYSSTRVTIKKSK